MSVVLFMSCSWCVRVVCELCTRCQLGVSPAESFVSWGPARQSCDAHDLAKRALQKANYEYKNSFKLPCARCATRVSFLPKSMSALHEFFERGGGGRKTHTMCPANNQL